MAKEEKIGITAKKDKHFSEWYTQVMIKSELADYTEVSGCIVFRPGSYAIWEKIRDYCDKEFKKTGVKNAYFPLLIPEKLLSKEAEHVEGFTPEVAWVTEAGNTKLAERLAVRPTSETIMYDSYSKWIRSWRDLPLKLNQWNNVVRWEFKHPVPFLRTREFLWNEGHTVYATEKEADAERDIILNIYINCLKELMALPCLPGKKSDKEKFAGAEASYSLECYLPNGKAIQGPDFHSDGQNFAEAYNIKFIDKDEKEQYAYQNTWAITTRMIGVMLAIHSDDKGLVIPPKLAENKAVIVPIIFGDDTKEAILKEAKSLEKELKDFNPILDDRDDKTAGWKFNEWELKGIPIRIEIGPRDLEKNQVIVVRRDTLKKEPIKLKDLKKQIPVILESIHNDLYKKAGNLLKNNITKAEKWNDLAKSIKDQKIVLAPWCTTTACEESIKEKTGAKTLNMPLDQKSVKGKCINCDKPAKAYVYIGKSY